MDEAELNRQLKMSIDDYGVHYEQKEPHIDETLPSFEGMQVHFTESLEVTLHDLLKFSRFHS